MESSPAAMTDEQLISDLRDALLAQWERAERAEKWNDFWRMATGRLAEEIAEMKKGAGE